MSWQLSDFFRSFVDPSYEGGFFCAKIELLIDTQFVAQMYLSASVKIPEVPGKITRRKMGNKIYVLFETGRVYDPKRRFNVPQRATIGKLLPGADDSLMQPNEKFLELFPERCLEPVEPAPVRSNTISVGTFLALDSVAKEYELQKLLQNAFGCAAGFILDLAAYMIVNEENAGQYYPDYARRHPLFTQDMRVLSDSSVSRLLSRMDRDQITTFLDAWNARQDHRQRIYVSYDSTNKNSQAGDLDLVEFGHPKTDQGLPIINLSLAFDQTNQVPLFYELYPGSIPDVSQLRYLIEKIVAYNYRSVGVVLDRGYFSRANIEFMDENKIQFLLMMKGCKTLVSDLISASQGSFETDRANRVPGADVYGTTIRHKLYITDKKQRYFHLFFSPSKLAQERTRLEFHLDAMADELRKLEGREVEVEAPYSRYFTCHYLGIKKGERKFLFAEEKREVIKRELELCGYFCIISSEKMTAQEAYRLYRGRDISEKLFRSDKSFLGSRSQRVHSNDATQAKTFIEFVALIVRNRFYNLLKAQMQRLQTRQNTMTVPGAIRELEKIEMTKRNGAQYILDYALTKTQKVILQSFGMSAEDAVSRVAEIARKLAESQNEITEEQREEDDAQTEVDELY